MKNVALPIFTILLLAACSTWTYKVPTAAMEPTIKMGDSIITKPDYYQSHPVQRFDIVVFRTKMPPENKTELHVQRVIGLGGETVELKRGKVFINGQPLAEQSAVIP